MLIAVSDAENLPVGVTNARLEFEVQTQTSSVARRPAFNNAVASTGLFVVAILYITEFAASKNSGD